MKKRNAAAAAIAGCALLLSGCGQKGAVQEWNASENSIYVTKSGGVESAMVYQSDQANDLYTQEGLEAYAQEAVDAYNGAHGLGEGAGEDPQTQPVILEECRLEDRTGTLVFSYGTPEDFIQFAQETGDNTHSMTGLKTGTVEQLAGELPEAGFLTAAGKEAETSAVKKDGKQTAVKAEGAGTVYVEGQVAFVTGDVTVKAANAVITPEGESWIILE